MDGGDDGEEEGVSETLEVDGVTKDFENVGQGKVAAAVEEGAPEGFADGEEKETCEEGNREGEDGDGEGLGLLLEPS